MKMYYRSRPYEIAYGLKELDHNRATSIFTDILPITAKELFHNVVIIDHRITLYIGKITNIDHVDKTVFRPNF